MQNSQQCPSDSKVALNLQRHASKPSEGDMAQQAAQSKQVATKSKKKRETKASLAHQLRRSNTSNIV